jgi:hypothetical protein
LGSIQTTWRVNKSWKPLFYSSEEGKKHPMNHTTQHGSPAKTDRDHFSGPLTTVTFIASIPLSPPSLFLTFHLQNSVLYTPSFYFILVFLFYSPSFLLSLTFFPMTLSIKTALCWVTGFFSTHFSQYLPLFISSLFHLVYLFLLPLLHTFLLHFLISSLKTAKTNPSHTNGSYWFAHSITLSPSFPISVPFSIQSLLFYLEVRGSKLQNIPTYKTTRCHTPGRLYFKELKCSVHDKN